MQLISHRFYKKLKPRANYPKIS